MVKALKIGALVAKWTVTAIVVLLLGAASVGFLAIASLPWEGARMALAGIFALTAVGIFVKLRPLWKGLVAFVCLFLATFTWYQLIPASNHRSWLPDVAKVASADFDGDRVTIRNIRNFRYRAVDDYDAAWDTRTYDLTRLTTSEVFFCYWGPKALAHTMLSFGFDGGEFLCISVETRKEVGENYSPIKSLFKQFELIYIFGDERDLVGLRSHHRRENLYLFPMNLTIAQGRALLLGIIDRANSLSDKPEFYRTIADNCTTSLLRHIDKAKGEPTPFSFKLLLNGYMPELAYERGTIPTDAPLEEVLTRFAVSTKAREGDIDEDFSRRIRIGVGKVQEK